VRYSLSDFYGLLRTPAGRIQIREGIRYRSWPLLSRLAKLHRATLANKTHVIAIVGSYGKTTTTYATTVALGLPIHPEFSYNCWSGLAQAMLRIRRSQRFAVIEAGINAPGQMKEYAALVRPDIAVVTSIGTEHHRSLHTLEQTRDEKAAMVRRLPATGTAILNGDDPNVMWMKSQTQARIVTFGFGEANDIRATDVQLNWPHGTRFVIHVDGNSQEMSVRLIGDRMVYPILAAIAVARTAGINMDQVLHSLEALQPVSGRLQPMELANGVWLLRDDHKSPMETINNALEVFGQIPAKRKIVALGAVTEPTGKQGPIYREIGEKVGALVSLVVVISSNKDFESYATGAARRGLPRSAIVSAGHSNQLAAKILQEQLQPGDVLLIKGRFEQHLERIALSLMGRTVRCDIEPCWLKKHCEECPMLERGWTQTKPVT